MIDEIYEIAIGLRGQMVEFIPKAMMALLVLIIGYLLARLVKILATRLIRYISQLVNRRFEQINLKESAGIIGTGIFWFVMVTTFLIMSDILKFTLLSTGIKSILQYSPNLLAAALTVFIAFVAGKYLANLISSVSTNIDISYGDTLGRITQYFIMITAIIIAIDQIGIEIDFFINIINIILAALLFGAALAFGLGARTSISNILAIFYVRKMYKEGDEIRIGEIEGKVKRIDSIAVVLDTESGQYTIPAKEFNEHNSLLLKKK